MRFGFIDSRPLRLVPLFIPFPLTHSFFFFSFMSSLASCPVIPSLSFFCTALSMYMHNLLSTQASGRPGLYNEVGCHRLSLCTWFPFIATTHTHLCPVLSPLHVFILVSYCAHTYTFALTLVLLASPRGGVCVCNPWSDRDPLGLLFGVILIRFAGGGRVAAWLSPTKLHAVD